NGVPRMITQTASCLRGVSVMRTRSRNPRLHVELLEDRWMPSIFLVENLADSGLGSLRQAILDANAQPGADLIAFAPAARDGAVALTTGQLSITDDLTIDGPGADRLAVSGNDASRVFRVGSGVSVDIDDLTITHGRADNGGGIWNAGGNLSLRHVIVSQNQALGAPGNQGQGGGVFNQGGALTVAHSTFSGNVAIGGLRLGAPVTQGRGGGIIPHAPNIGTESKIWKLCVSSDSIARLGFVSRSARH